MVKARLTNDRSDEPPLYAIGRSVRYHFRVWIGGADEARRFPGWITTVASSGKSHTRQTKRTGQRV
jgi:hypothetical protein